MPRNRRRRPHHEAGKQNMRDGRWSATNGRRGGKPDGRDRTGTWEGRLRTHLAIHTRSHYWAWNYQESIRPDFSGPASVLVIKFCKLRFACNFGRRVPYFWGHGPSYFAGRLARRENSSRPLSPWNSAENVFCKICTASSLCFAGGPCFSSGRVAPLFSR